MHPRLDIPRHRSGPLIQKPFLHSAHENEQEDTWISTILDALARTSNHWRSREGIVRRFSLDKYFNTHSKWSDLGGSAICYRIDRSDCSTGLLNRAEGRLFVGAAVMKRVTCLFHALMKIDKHKDGAKKGATGRWIDAGWKWWRCVR